MTIRVIAAAAATGLGLLAAACQPAAPPKPETATGEPPVVQTPTEPAAPDLFADAANFECEGGGKVDVVFQGGSPPSVLYRLDSGAAIKLLIDETATMSTIFRDPTTSISLEGDTLTLTSGGATKPCKFVSRSLPPPIAPDVVRNLTAEDVGAAVEMKVGEKISVSLSGVPTAGYVWGADNPPAFVKVSEGPGGSTSTAQFLPGFTGGNHWEVLVIEGVAAGGGEIALVQKRPWEDKADPADERFKFKLTVK